MAKKPGRFFAVVVGLEIEDECLFVGLAFEFGAAVVDAVDLWGIVLGFKREKMREKRKA